MSEDKKTLIDLVPDSVDNAVKNITDKPTQNMGTTLADIWYLVFGGISQAAEKRKLKYSYALHEFENELKKKISQIPKDKLVEPDIQIIAQALEAAKYCVEKEELRHMFANLIANSLNDDTYEDVHPIYISIIKSLTPFDAKLLLDFHNQKFEFDFNFGDIIYSMDILSQLGLITYKRKHFETSSDKFIEEEITETEAILRFNFDVPLKEIPNVIFRDKDGNKINPKTNILYDEVKKNFESLFMEKVHITKLGYDFIQTCL